MPSAQLQLPPDARSVPAARRFLRESLGRWRAAGFEWAAAQVVTELATNAAIHARTDYLVRVSLADDRLRIEVADGSTRQPLLRHYGPQAATGRGLALVDRLSRSWGARRDSRGKTVWAELLSGPAEVIEPEPAVDVVELLGEDWNGLGHAAVQDRSAA